MNEFGSTTGNVRQHNIHMLATGTRTFTVMRTSVEGRMELSPTTQEEMEVEDAERDDPGRRARGG